jgi:aspartate/methionine/tyrosine aminotransferase
MSFEHGRERAAMFSSRLRQGAGRNRLTVALDERRAAGRPIVDLTLSNPTVAGFAYPPDLLRPLAHERALLYQPMPFGLPAARAAVSADFSRRGSAIPSERIVLTASTSEAYSLLFKLLCDPGDAVLAPRPSYPLVEHLAELDAVVLDAYSLEFHGTWSIDIAGIRERLEIASREHRRVRAIILISPNNPTGSIVKPEEARALSVLAREYGLALIVDEVFSDYRLGGREAAGVAAQIGQNALTFSLGGLSKTIGLPQVKLGWIGISGAEMLVTDAMERLETICDTYLSVSTPVQAATPDLLANGAGVRAQIQARIVGNLDQLKATAAAHPACSLLLPDGGWYAVLQVPNITSEESLVLDLLDRTGVLVHPGYFFDFEREAFLVISLLPEPALFARAVETLFHEIGCS